MRYTFLLPMFGCIIGAGMSFWFMRSFWHGYLYDPILWVALTENACATLGLIMCIWSAIYFGLKTLDITQNV